MALASLAFGLTMQDERGERGQRHGAQQPEQMLERMSAALNLTDDQKAQIKPLLEEQAKQTRAIFSDESLAREQKMEKIREVREATQKKIKPILTEEQQAKFAKMQERGPRPHKDKDENQTEKKNPDQQ
jgi:Spy/CpxP family protein refolding chaperone